MTDRQKALRDVLDAADDVAALDFDHVVVGLTNTERLVLAKLRATLERLRRIEIEARSKFAPKLTPYAEYECASLSVRTANCLHNAGVKDADGLLAVDLERVLRWRNAGRKTVEEIREAQRFVRERRAMAMTHVKEGAR